MESIEKIRGIVLSAIDYAVKYNLPLPSDIAHCYFLHGGDLPDWAACHFNEPSSKHHAYYRFAVEEYPKLIRFLATGEGEIGELRWGEQLVELVQRNLLGLKSPFGGKHEGNS